MPPPHGYLCQGLAYEDHAMTALHGYRWKKFGMPLRVFKEETYLLQPLLVMSQVRARWVVRMAGRPKRQTGLKGGTRE